MSATRIGSGPTASAPGAGGEPTTAFVLSGGASLGAQQVGMLEALYERGIVPDLLVATSVGALNAAFIASREQTVSTARELGRVWRELRREDIFPVSISALMGGFCGRRNHLVTNRGLRQLLRLYLEFEELAAATIPLHLVAIELMGGRELLLSEGPAAAAIMAAAAIPVVFPPVEIAGRWLIDGGAINYTPISHALALGAERIYVLSTRHPDSLPQCTPRSALDAAMCRLGLPVDARLQSDIARYSAEVELIVLPATNPAGVQPTSFEHSARLINEARFAARAELARQDGGRHLRLVS